MKKLRKGKIAFKGVSDEEYAEIVAEYWMDKESNQKAEKKEEKSIRIPENLKEHPNFPQKSENISEDEYIVMVKKYWSDNARKERQERKLEKSIPEDLEEYPDFPEFTGMVTVNTCHIRFWLG